MPNGYSRSPLLAKGAFIQLTESIAGPIPNVIVFQYNPETLSRKLEPWQPPETSSTPGDTQGQADPQAQPFDPKETIDLVLEFDATDAMEHPEQNPVEAVTGIADRIAAMERLLYPVEENGGLLGDVAALLGGASATVSRTTVPVVLFSFGPNLIVPIRITTYQVEEQAFSPTLYPIRAKCTVSLKVLTDKDFPSTGDNAQTSLAAEIARTAYRFTRAQRDALALANIGNAASSILGLLPL